MTFSPTLQGPSKWDIVVMRPRDQCDPGWLPKSHGPLAASDEGGSIKIPINLMTQQKARLEYLAVSLTARAADSALGGADKSLFQSFADSSRQEPELTGHSQARAGGVRPVGLCLTLVLQGVKKGGYCYKSKTTVLFLGLQPAKHSPGGQSTGSHFKGTQPLPCMLSAPARLWSRSADQSR